MLLLVSYAKKNVKIITLCEIKFLMEHVVIWEGERSYISCTSQQWAMVCAPEQTG